MRSRQRSPNLKLLSDNQRAVLADDPELDDSSRFASLQGDQRMDPSEVDPESRTQNLAKLLLAVIHMPSIKVTRLLIKPRQYAREEVGSWNTAISNRRRCDPILRVDFD